MSKEGGSWGKNNIWGHIGPPIEFYSNKIDKPVNVVTVVAGGLMAAAEVISSVNPAIGMGIMAVGLMGLGLNKVGTEPLIQWMKKQSHKAPSAGKHVFA
jgi:hypothetical protein